MKTIPEKLINYSVYLNGTQYLGAADVTLPTIESLTETFSGAGIAGEVDSPTLGHYASMTVSMTWRTLTKESMLLLAPESHLIDFRMSQQLYNTATSSLGSSGARVTIKGMPKSGELGTLNVGQTTGTTNEIEVTYIKVVSESLTILEIDKFAFKAIINGKDYLADVRKQLGM